MNDLDHVEKLCSEIALSDFGPRMVIRNWDTICASQLFTGQGFKINSKKSFDNKGNKYIDGIHSPKFGTTWEDEDAFRSRYTCKCGHLMGTVYEGEVCPECGTKVDFVDVDMQKFGWICMNSNFKIINPAAYALLQKFLGATTLKRIITFDRELDTDGHFVEPTGKSARERFASIGLTGLRERLIEILEYYRPKKKNKEAIYWELIQKWDCIFASCIPVYSAWLRPIFTSPSEYTYTNVERAFNVITGCKNKLNAYPSRLDETNIGAINALLLQIQEKVLAVDEYTFKLLDSKTGHIHDGIFGGRLDFSARDVIVPDPTLRAYEIRLSYLAVLELYKLEIINMITKINGCTYDAALKYWFDAHISFNRFVYEVMIHLVNKTKYGMMCLINRNPQLGAHVGDYMCESA